MEIQYICPYCNKQLLTNNALGSHKRLCIKNPDRKIINTSYTNKLKTGELKPWCYGKTKETDETVARIAKALSENYSGENHPWYGRHHTEETKKKLAAYGGYRKGSGTGKSGWYKGYYCDSSWELAFVIYNLEHNIKFERNKKMFPYTYNGEEHNYLPDWLVDGKYVEIKGHDSEQWQAKVEQFPKDLTLEILYRDNMQKYLEYVRDKYGNNFIELYDDSKPVKNINDQVATWFYLKNEKTGKFIQLYVFKENYDIYLNNGWSLGKYLPSVHKNYTLIKHTNVRRVSEIEKEKILRNMIN